MTQLTNSDRILEAALACFDKFGIAKTTMDDVAEAAQLARMTVYRLFKSRNELLQAVALQRMERFAVELVSVVRPRTSFEDAIVKISIKGVELARNDPLFLSLLENTDGRGGANRFIVVADSPIDKLMHQIWGDIFAKGRAEGKLKADIEDRDLVAWFRDVQFILLLRDDLDRRGQEKLLRRFVVPALINN